MGGVLQGHWVWLQSVNMRDPCVVGTGQYLDYDGGHRNLHMIKVDNT